MNQSQIISAVAESVKQKFDGESSGHDWWHIYRVWQLSKTIAQSEADANLLVVELGALLHDIADWKFHDGNEDVGPVLAGEILHKLGVEEPTISQVQSIISHISYKGASVVAEPMSIEGQIVQDADRLDAMGAIGVARCFAYGGSANRPMWDPNIKPTLHTSKAAYKNSKSNSINHFYEKLLLLKDRMNTQTGKQLATSRHTYLEQFLAKFYAEWEGKE